MIVDFIYKYINLYSGLFKQFDLTIDKFNSKFISRSILHFHKL